MTLGSGSLGSLNERLEDAAWLHCLVAFLLTKNVLLMKKYPTLKVGTVADLKGSFSPSGSPAALAAVVLLSSLTLSNVLKKAHGNHP